MALDPNAARRAAARPRPATRLTSLRPVLRSWSPQAGTVAVATRRSRLAGPCPTIAAARSVRSRHAGPRRPFDDKRSPCPSRCRRARRRGSRVPRASSIRRPTPGRRKLVRGCGEVDRPRRLEVGLHVSSSPASSMSASPARPVAPPPPWPCETADPARPARRSRGRRSARHPPISCPQSEAGRRDRPRPEASAPNIAPGPRRKGRTVHSSHSRSNPPRWVPWPRGRARRQGSGEAGGLTRVHRPAPHRPRGLGRPRRSSPARADPPAWRNERRVAAGSGSWRRGPRRIERRSISGAAASSPHPHAAASPSPPNCKTRPPAYVLLSTRRRSEPPSTTTRSRHGRGAMPRLASLRLNLVNPPRLPKGAR